VAASFVVRVGQFNPTQRYEDTAPGTAFRFVARDSDGLPITGEFFQGVPRTSSFLAQLHMIDESSPLSIEQQIDLSIRNTANPPPSLPINFVGNKELQEDNTWGPVVSPHFERDGEMEVEVSLPRTGPHVVTIKGPKGDNSADYLQPTRFFNWRVHVSGICPVGQRDIGGRNCGCSAGYEKADCSPCKQGSIKLNQGEGVCTACAMTIFPGIGHDPARTETRQEASSQYEECGCSADTYLPMRARKLAAEELSVACPSLTQYKFQTSSKYFDYVGDCCNNATRAQAE
jgi:hypothetical protein